MPRALRALDDKHMAYLRQIPFKERAPSQIRPDQRAELRWRWRDSWRPGKWPGRTRPERRLAWRGKCRPHLEAAAD